MNNNWEIKKLGEVCEVIAGQSPESKYYNSNGNGLPFYQGKKEFTEKYIGKPTTWTTEITKEAFKDDVLISVRAPVGPVNFATEKICIGRGLAAIRASNEIDKEFLFNFLVKHENEIIGNTGAVFNSINKKQIENINIPLPPLTEQKRIVAILNETLYAISKVKDNTEKNLANAKELFESYLNGAFSNPGDGQGTEPAEVWEKKTLDQIAVNLDSKRIPVTKNVRNTGKYPYYGASGIVDYIDEYIFDDNLLLVSEDGANLLARTYPIAFSINGKSWVNNHAHVLKFKHIESQRFVEYYLNSIKLDDFVSGMAQPKLNQKMLNSIPIPFPKIDTQKSIISRLNELSAETKRLEEIYKRKIADCDELKKAVLEKAFRGELTQTININECLEFPLKIKGISSTDLHAGILAIAYLLHEEQGKQNYFGHVKAEKISHMVESYVGIDLDRNPIKDAAGPNDFNHFKRKVEPRARKANYFHFEEISDGEFQFIKGRQINFLVDKTKEKLGNRLNEINNLIKLMIPMNTKQAEIFATVYAAWNNLLLDQKIITDEAIVYEARENWHPDKLKIPRERFFDAIKWMKNKNIIPNGQGKKVEKK